MCLLSVIIVYDSSDFYKSWKVTVESDGSDGLHVTEQSKAKQRQLSEDTQRFRLKSQHLNSQEFTYSNMLNIFLSDIQFKYS